MPSCREVLMEALSEVEDSIMERFLEGEDIPLGDIKTALRKATLERAFVPVLCGSAFKNKGVQPLLDTICAYLPSPIDTDTMTGFDPKEDKEIVKAYSRGKFSGIAFKIMSDPFVGLLTYVRIYSGKIKQGDTFINTRTQKKNVHRKYCVCRRIKETK